MERGGSGPGEQAWLCMIDYPKTPPTWLSSWPSEAELRNAFPEGIRRHAFRALGRERIQALDWTDAGLVLTLGDQKKWMYSLLATP